MNERFFKKIATHFVAIVLFFGLGLALAPVLDISNIDTLVWVVFAIVILAFCIGLSALSE